VSPPSRSTPPGCLGNRLSRRTAYAWPALVITAALLLVNITLDRSFLSAANWAPILAVAMPFVVVSMAAVPSILSGSGGIDLSIGPLSGLVNTVLVAGLFAHGYTSPALALPAAVLIGASAGALNGVLVVLVRVPPIIATLGTYLVWSGLSLRIMPMSGGRAPDWLIALNGSWAGVPLPILPLLVIALVWWPLRQSAYGRNLLATGGDQRAAFTSGVQVDAVRLVAYTAGGELAAMAGFAFTVALGSGDPLAANPYTLIGIAGAVLGGVSLSGGRGGLLGAAAGGAVLFLIQNLLSLAHVSSFYSQVAYGVILILSLAINSFGADLRRRRDRAANAGIIGPVA